MNSIAGPNRGLLRIGCFRSGAIAMASARLHPTAVNTKLPENSPHRANVVG
jgi:hypothetical protein